MNRRELLKAFRDFCILNGISGVLAPEAFGQTVAAKKRFVSFVIKYTGGTTLSNGIGQWNFANTLAPLAPYRNELCIPLGLNCEFTNGLNSHGAPQVSALTGSSTGTTRAPDGTRLPSGNIQNYTTGNGKSIDVLIGEKLQSLYKTQLSTLQISSRDPKPEERAGDFAHSSYGNNGVLLSSFSYVNELTNELKNRISCDSPVNNPILMADLNRKVAALNFIKSNNNIFNSNYLIDKDKFENLQSKTLKSQDSLKSALNNAGIKPAICGKFPIIPNTNSYNNAASISIKMDAMYDLAIAAFQANVTRSININLYRGDEHYYSHFGPEGKIEVGKYNTYLDIAKWLQLQIANFIAKLKAAGLYDETLIFCNAGSSMTNQVHNYDNLSTYIINGGKSGTVGDPRTKKPVGSLLLDILHKFDIKYDKFGGTNHVLGVATKGNFI